MNTRVKTSINGNLITEIYIIIIKVILHYLACKALVFIESLLQLNQTALITKHSKLLFGEKKLLKVGD